MNNEILSNSDIKEMLQITAMNQKSISEQMGIVTSAVKEIRGNVADVKNEINVLNERMQGYEDRIRIDRNQARRLRNAIHARCNDLLGIVYENGVVTQESLFADKHYKGGFIGRCYKDARDHSELGTPYTETYVKDYDEVMRYVSAWEPEMAYAGISGVAGYKLYLDERRRVKNARGR